MLNTRLGTELHPDDRRHVLASFVHRMTTESRKAWPAFASYMIDHGYRMPERTDAQWLTETRFAVKKNGRLDKRSRYCQTTYSSQVNA